MAETTIRQDTSKRHRDKYSNPNPIHRLTLGRFFEQLAEDMIALSPVRLLEFGCGEALGLLNLKQRGLTYETYLGIDLREDALRYARTLHPDDVFLNRNLLTWDFPTEGYDTVLASQVLEHLPDPGPYLKRLGEISTGHVVLTVPWEPWFRLMNFLRGRDLWRLGNHPEHVNLWGMRAFRRFVSGYLDIVKAHTVFPFIIVIARKKA